MRIEKKEDKRKPLVTLPFRIFANRKRKAPAREKEKDGQTQRLETILHCSVPSASSRGS